MKMTVLRKSYRVQMHLVDEVTVLRGFPYRFLFVKHSNDHSSYI